MSGISPEEVDRVLEEFLPCDSDVIASRTLAKLAKSTHQAEGIRERRDGDPWRRLIWGLAVGARPYAPTLHGRRLRDGWPWTWAEIKILKWAFPPLGRLPEESKARPTAASVAVILQRREDDVAAAKTKYLSHGIVGFGFTKE